MNAMTKSHVQCVLPNLFYEYTTGSTSAELGHNIIDHFMDGVIRRVSKQNPSWKIYATGRSVTDSVTDDGTKIYRLNNFRFEDSSRNVLGKVWRSYGRGGNTAFAIDNEAMNRERSRGDATYTADENRAVKIIKANFRPAPLSHVLGQRTAAVGRLISGNVHATVRQHQKLAAALEPAIDKFVEEHWKAFQHFVQDNGFDYEATLAFREAEEDRAAAAELSALYNSSDPKAGTVVYVREDDYVMVNDGKYRIRTQEQLTPEERACMGVLQLQHDETIVPGFGARVSNDTYFITPSKVTGLD